jgi:predicted MFS family arabinose efflux permease
VAGRRLPDARSDADAPSATAHLPARFTWFPVACLLLIAGSQPLFSWSMPYLHETIGVALPTAGRLTAVAALTGVASMVLVTWQSDRLAPTARVPTVITLCAVTAASQLLLVILQGAALASVALVPATTAQLADISLMHAAVVEAAPSTVGQASGVTMTGYYLGALLAPPLFGYLVDTTGSFLLPWLCCAVLAVAAAGCFAPCRKVGPRPLA